MTDRELMQMALDALEEAQDYTSCPTYSPSMTQQCATAAVALRARLAQPEQEPVAWMYNGNLHLFDPSDWADGTVTPLYNSPPQREWIGLTDEEIESIYAACDEWGGFEYERAIEAKLKEKNA